MRLETWHKWEIDRRGYGVPSVIDLKFKGKTWMLETGAGSFDPVNVFREPGTSVFYIYTENSNLGYVGVEKYDLDAIEWSEGYDKNDVYTTHETIFLQDPWNVEEVLGKRWYEKTGLRNTKILAQWFY